MIKLRKAYKMIPFQYFVFNGDIHELTCSQPLIVSNPDMLVEVYDTRRNPQKMVFQAFLNTLEKKGLAMLYGCERKDIECIEEFWDVSMVYENADPVFDRNKWLLDFTEQDDGKQIMRIDDEYDTYDGQYLYHELIFENNILNSIKHTYIDKEGYERTET